MRRRLKGAAACAALIGAALVPAASAHEEHAEDDARPVAAQAPTGPGSCVALRSEANGAYVARSGAGYRADAGLAGREVLRLQPTTDNAYLLLDSRGTMPAAFRRSGVRAVRSGDTLADWKLSEKRGIATLRSPATGRTLAVSPGGRLVLATRPDPRAARFRAVPAQGCVAAPEIETSSTGEPGRGPSPFGEVSGFLDSHVHLMAFEFLGGRAHCGRPWHPGGVTQALVDCPDHEPGGFGALLENFISKKPPISGHDTVGWPTFRDWPAHDSLTHEQTYYKWIERTWRGGLRLMVNLLVDNEVLCQVYPYKKNSCDEMETVRLQIKRTFEMQAYIDSKSGGPGKGWFRVVTNPFEARRVINDGKLAVVMGIEVSKLFGCDIYNGVPECDRADIDRQLEEFHRLGVRDLELVNKFDNALSGVAFDSGTTGVAINQANKLQTGQYWQAETCPGRGTDRTLVTSAPNGRDQLLGAGLLQLLPAGQVPIYPPPPHCNKLGLTDLGEHLIRRMVEKQMIVDLDHMSVVGRRQALNLIESLDYSGVVSSHSWADVEALPRILRAGGVVGPYAGSSTSYAKAWRELRAMKEPGKFFGIGFGPDSNGFGAQGGPRPNNDANPVRYPFKSYDGKVTFQRQRSGERVFDLNEEGVAHYGLYPDWVEDLRQLEGPRIVNDMARGAEAYLQMWERAEGVEAERCRPGRALMGARGFKRIKLGTFADDLLRSAGQPTRRLSRNWRWCVQGRPGKRVAVVLSPAGKVSLVLSNAARHRSGKGIVGKKVRPLRGKTRKLSGGLRIARRPAKGGARRIYGFSRGRVNWVGVVNRGLAKRPKALRRQVKVALKGRTLRPPD